MRIVVSNLAASLVFPRQDYSFSISARKFLWSLMRLYNFTGVSTTTAVRPGGPSGGPVLHVTATTPYKNIAVWPREIKLVKGHEQIC